MRNASTGLLPPISNTGVEPLLTVNVGWLGGTYGAGSEVPAPPDPWQAVRLLQSLWPGGSTQHRGTTWYSKGVRHDAGLWVVLYEGVGTARGTVAVTVRQDATEGNLRAVLAVLGSGLRPSRLDLSADASGTSPRPRAYFDARNEARTRTRRAGWVYREDGAGLASLTVGSRSSERYLRVYDKPTAAGQRRVRHELELKGDLAVAIARTLADGAEPAAAWATEYGRLVVWPSALALTTTASGSPSGATPRAATAT